MTTQPMLELDKEQLTGRLQRLAEEMIKNEDLQSGSKIKQLADKVQRGELIFAFCGHFSAGKSSMINTLLGTNLLPSNPIPTSANVVKVRGGEPAARVYTRNSGVLTFDPATQMEELKAYAVDGDTVEWVEVQFPNSLLNEQASLLDTPGIDSTDAAHKIATESALHLADVVIYMMDYNHVQAEENFHFTKTLQDRQKPVYLVINMIDKHLDFELDFESYKESVEEAFATWNIRPQGIFYTSLAEPDHPENQYEAFRDTLKQVMNRSEEWIFRSAKNAALYVLEEHRQFLNRKHEEERRRLENLLETEAVEELDPTDAVMVSRAVEETAEQLARLEEQAKQGRAAMERELSSLLENARLTYFSTNEAAERYLESRKPGFKVGWLLSGKKTEEERARRLQALLSDFQEKVNANLDWHFKELLKKFPEMAGIRDEAYHEQVHALELPVTVELLEAQVKEGAGTREYVLNYCKDISDAVKARYKQAGMSFIDEIAGKIAARLQVEKEACQSRLERLQQLADAHQRLAALNEQEDQTITALRNILNEGA